MELAKTQDQIQRKILHAPHSNQLQITECFGTKMSTNVHCWRTVVKSPFKGQSNTKAQPQSKHRPDKNGNKHDIKHCSCAIENAALRICESHQISTSEYEGKLYWITHQSHPPIFRK